MKESKRERDRRKQAEARKRKARQQVQQAQADARVWRSFDVAERAQEALEHGEVGDALREAARASALNPGDPEIARLYLAVADRSGDLNEQVKALERVTRTVPPDARLYARLAYLCLHTGDPESAGRAAARARQLLPARLKERKRWLSIIEYVEARCAAIRTGVAAPPERSRPAAARPRPRAPVSAAAPAPAVAIRRRKDPPPPQTARKPAVQGSEAAPAVAGAAAGAAAAHPAPEALPVAPVSLLGLPLAIAPAVDGLEVLADATFTDRESVELAVLAAKIRDAVAYDQLFAIEQARGLLHFAHQEDTARKVMSVFLGRALLADEVGLGKTIEAGLVLSEYLLRGHVSRALILAPPTLVGQWREELATKFGIEARTSEDAAFRADPDRFWSDAGIVIASLATARSPRQRERVTARPWDLAIVDEAHVLKNATTASHALVSRITSRFLLLLTATPVENRLEELYNLVSLIRPGHLGGRATFLKRFADTKVRSSDAVRAQVRALLAEVMVRNTRALSGVQLPPRFARTVLIQPEAGEAELYEHLVRALRSIGPGGKTRLLLSVLLREAGSSPFAVRGTLEKTRDQPDLPAAAAAALAPAIRFVEQPVATGKGRALLEILDGAREPAVVFTHYRATLAFLDELLGRAGIARERIDSNVPAPLRHEAIDRLRARGGVLLSTEVGAEGLNLQFCRRIVNFDLPWNPMRIEQRIGRVHRIGQDHPVEVVNLCLAGSIEERILSILDERINLFELVVGEVEMILGYLEDERDFDDLVLEAFAEPEVAGREQSFARIADALAAARLRYENVKRFDEEFFRNELGA